MSCEEGGSHQFSMPKKRSCCLQTVKLCCCPCWAFMSCAMSNGKSALNLLSCTFAGVVSRAQGAAFTSSVGMHGGSEDGPEMTCLKCGLTKSEARALQGPGYFSNQGMTIPTTTITTQHSRGEPEFSSPTTSYPPPSALNRSPERLRTDRLTLPSHEDASSLGTPVTPQRSQEGNPAVAWVARQQAYQAQQHDSD
ncbi:BZ3500_MvSof-1268-A1-R1_Chr1-3g02053 [Microbotryum saponariae]|uniref:BZ3500_MvSof-1268-A1-R1_Chr1-3g02053 protein n=1 Tax=Microbotryum saponariae TaxID=289078 RepID=A0A2X0L4F5_9BASI|nr:BZ3500_MvSof-1268-A1-R1_Chr1-3g02053 [Microbotryum saponariae]SCZ95268.1 BZ3501_MvSof-1269-A2-R1_Chr1-3g01655 [Microbotryum saponariae]